MIELELTYLAKLLPENLKENASKHIIDLYIEDGTDHPNLRVRKNGDTFELTRKVPVESGDASRQTETTIEINEYEFESLSSAKCRKVEKVRYFYTYNNRTAEFDVFADALKGLVTVDFEFDSEAEKDSFEMPDFCLADITQESFVAGGMLAGKTYADIEKYLDSFGYTKL